MPAPFTAADARKAVADHFLAAVDVSDLLDHIHDKIKLAASAGQTSIANPLDDLPGHKKTVLHTKAVSKILRGEGYYVELFFGGTSVGGSTAIEAKMHTISWEQLT